MTATDTGSDIGKTTIKVRKVTSWQPNWSASGSGEQGTYVFQLILDDGAADIERLKSQVQGLAGGAFGDDLSILRVDFGR